MRKTSRIRRCAIWTRENWPKVLLGTGAFFFIVAVTVAAHVLSEYSHYSSLVRARLADKSIYRPAGIYAAPRHLSVGQQISRQGLIERLQRAGYQSGESANEFAAGTFIESADRIIIRTNDFSRTELTPATAAVSFNKESIARIEDADAGKATTAMLLPAEMLTAEFDAKLQSRSTTRYEELPPQLIAAITAIEDRRFFSHSGIDLKGIIRAAYQNLVNGRVVQGGSTITQQFIKNQFLSPDRTMNRKFAEALMAIALEQQMSKEQILTLYCDRIYLGHSGSVSIYGFKQAARIYFGKELRNLTVAESAFLAGLVQAPNHYSPYKKLDRAIERRNVVLDKMVETGAISQSEAEAAKQDQVALKPQLPIDNSSAPYFIDYVQRELTRTNIEEDVWPQLQIDTTLDMDLQQAANKVVAQHLDRLAGNRKQGARPEAALVALDPETGEILAMVGGRNYAESQLNRATDAHRQPGSVFKPIVYATALSRGISPATTFKDAPHEFTYASYSTYKPENFGHSYSNQQVTLRESLVRSLNVVTVDVAMQVGLSSIAGMAEKMGLPRPQSYPSMALGASEATPLEMAAAYTTFANAGTKVTPLAIRTAKAEGQELYSGSAMKVGLLPPSTAYLVTDALGDVVNRGTAARVRALGYKGPAAGKTGTSRDAWFVGYTPKLLVAVWVGYDDNRDLGLTGGEAAVPIWTDFIKAAMAVRPDLRADKFKEPGGLQTVEICAENGMAANEYCPHRQKMLL
ncbi:MAG TPA: PBP1A family penicillin-binding protein, partial [Blastocatellia bacterium]|nr:PBP1A family penicillin-binding protein [Blastocatellia bacterium]